MLKIDNNKITLTKGDTLTLSLSLTRGGEAYTPEETDVIRFALAKGYVGRAGYDLILQKNFPLDTMMITISADETEVLTYRTYTYDVQITHGDGSVDTVISSTLTITEEVE